MAYSKEINRFLFVRLGLLSLAVLFLGGLFIFIIQHTQKIPLKNISVLAVPGSLNIPSSSQTFTTGTMNVTSIIIGGVDYSNDIKNLSTNLSNKAPLANPTFTGTASFGNATVTGITKTSVGLGNVDNTSDVDKPVSTLQAASVALKANINAPIFTGNVGIGTTGAASYNLQVAGSLYASGSSRRYKQNITDLEVDSEKIYNLRPVSYDYKPAYKSYGKELGGGRQLGLIAEEVYTVIPELTVKLDNKISNIDYEKLSVLLLSEMQKQKEEIDSLKSDLKSLKQKLILIESKLK